MRIGRPAKGLLVAGVAGVAAAGVARGRAGWLYSGATDEERRAVLAGDDLVIGADLVSTRGITIDCGPDAVWPWIAQLGQGRAAFYSYDWLENLAGCDMHSAERIVAEWQQVRAGDDVRIHPRVALQVAAVDSGRALILRGTVPVGIRPPFDFSWSFVLRERSDGTTRLVVRERYGYLCWWTAMMVEPVEVVSFVMSRKMLRGIKDRAERGATVRAADIAAAAPLS